MAELESVESIKTVPMEDLRVRDPFVLPVAAENRYYLFGSTPSIGARQFSCYYGTDLRNWTGPFRCFTPRPDYFGILDYWAAEVFRYHGRYYLLGTVRYPGRPRGTDILVSATDSPVGPYLPYTDNGPITPHGWACLDGTLFIDDDDVPWMVFCHEWSSLPNQDGRMCAVRLSNDLRRAVGQVKVLFNASEAPWSLPPDAPHVTDGPYLHRTQTGTLLMLWSTAAGPLNHGRYLQCVSRSESGTILGPWRHDQPLLVEDDGGHGMLFCDFSGQLNLMFHRPNRKPDERPHLLRIDDSTDQLRVIG